MRALTVVTCVAVAVPLNAQYGGMPPKERSSAVKGEVDKKKPLVLLYNICWWPLDVLP